MTACEIWGFYSSGFSTHVFLIVRLSIGFACSRCKKNQPFCIPHCGMTSTVTFHYFISCVCRYLSQPFYSNYILKIISVLPTRWKTESYLRQIPRQWRTMQVSLHQRPVFYGGGVGWQNSAFSPRSAKRYIARFQVLVTVGFLADLYDRMWFEGTNNVRPLGGFFFSRVNSSESLQNFPPSQHVCGE